MHASGYDLDCIKYFFINKDKYMPFYLRGERVLPRVDLQPTSGEIPVVRSVHQFPRQLFMLTYIRVSTHISYCLHAQYMFFH